jgi:putative oxidoreductase
MKINRQADSITITADCPPARTRAADAGVLLLRLGAGGILAGHGAQKLFGLFSGRGFQATAGMMESMNLRPGKLWAGMAGLSEFGGGILTALGFANPLGPIALQGAMFTASRRMHWKLPIFTAAGGPELPILYAVTGASIALTGPGRYSLDRLFGVRVPPALAALTGAGVAAGIALAEYRVAQGESDADTEAHPDTAAAAEDTLEDFIEQPADGEDYLIATQSLDDIPNTDRFAPATFDTDDTLSDLPEEWSNE